MVDEMCTEEDGWGGIPGDDNFEEEILSDCDANDVAHASSATADFFDLIGYDDFNSGDGGSHDPTSFPDIQHIQEVLTSSISNGNQKSIDGQKNLLVSNANNSRSAGDIEQYGIQNGVRAQRRRMTLDEVLFDPTGFNANFNSGMPPVQNQQASMEVRKSDPFDFSFWENMRRDMPLCNGVLGGNNGPGAQLEYMTSIPQQSPAAFMAASRELVSPQNIIEGSMNFFDSNANNQGEDNLVDEILSNCNNFNSRDGGSHDPTSFPDIPHSQQVLTSGISNIDGQTNLLVSNANNSRSAGDIEQYGIQNGVRAQRRRKTLDDILFDPTGFNANYNSGNSRDVGSHDPTSFPDIPHIQEVLTSGIPNGRRRKTIDGPTNVFDSNANNSRLVQNYGIQSGVRAQRRRKTLDDVLIDPMGFNANYNSGMPPVQNQQASMEVRKSDPFDFSFWDDNGRDMPLCNSVLGGNNDPGAQLDYMTSILQQAQSNSDMIPAALMAASREAFESINKLAKMYHVLVKQPQGDFPQGPSHRQFSIDRQESSHVAAAQQAQSIPKPKKNSPKKGSSNKHTTNSVPVVIDAQIPLPSKLDQELLNLDPTDVMSKLKASMERTNLTQKQLQDWDSARGLPKSHSQTMVNSSRSRKQIMDGVVLKVSFMKYWQISSCNFDIVGPKTLLV
jgi:hypothetical protein